MQLLLKGLTHQPDYNDVAFHLYNFIDPRIAKSIVKLAAQLLQQLDFDAIAFRGLSGALIAPTIAMEMDKSLIAVRKVEGEHSSNIVEGDRAARRYIIVDDFIATGRTVEKILDEVHKVAPQAECLGVLCASRLAEKSICPEITNSYIFNTEEVKAWRRRSKRRSQYDQTKTNSKQQSINIQTEACGEAIVPAQTA